MDIINSDTSEQNSWHANLKNLGVQIPRFEVFDPVTVNLFVL